MDIGLQRVSPPTTLAELKAFIEGDSALSSIRHEMDNATDDSSHDLNHALRVALTTLDIADESVAPRDAVAAALLHDVVHVSKSSPLRAQASELSANKAREILASHDFSASRTERIVAAIRDHSFSRGATPTDPLGCALQDADRLEALGAIGILRCAATGAAMGASLFDDADPWAATRPLDDRRYSIDHFFKKLLTLPATMTTNRGRELAEDRCRILHQLLDALAVELGVPRTR